MAKEIEDKKGEIKLERVDRKVDSRKIKLYTAEKKGVRGDWVA